MTGLLIYVTLETFSVLGAAFALWKGGAPERFAAGVIFLNVVIGEAARLLSPGLEDVLRLCNDGLAAVALLAITVRYGAPWMGGVMLFYAAQFALHSYYMVTERPRDYLHALINNVNWSGIIWCLIIGTAMTWRQRARTAHAQARQPAP